MPSKRLIRDSKIVQVMAAASISTATTQMNGNAQGTAIDAAGFDEAVLIVNHGSILGDGALYVQLYESTTSDPIAATAVSAALVATITATTTPSIYIGSQQIAGNNRYLFVKATKTGTGPIWAAISLILNQADNMPVSQVASVQFDNPVM